MIAVLTFLGIPIFGVLLVVAEDYRRHGITPRARIAGRTAVAILGGLVGVTGLAAAAGWLAYLVIDPESEPLLVRFISSLTLLLTAALFALAARNALRVGFHREADDSTSAMARSSRNGDDLRFSAWLLILFPALLLGVFGLLLVVPISACLVYGFAERTARRARESRFLWVLALAVERNLPLDDEIEAFAQTLWSSNRVKFEDVANRMREGRSLIDALELSGVLSNSLVTELRAAQTAGTLPQALRSLAASRTSSLMENRGERSIAVTVIYVWTLIALVFGVVGFLMYWIVPKFKDIFNDFGVELPMWTIQAIELSDSVVNNFMLIFPLLSLPIAVALGALLVTVVGWDRLNIPVLTRAFPRRDAPTLLRSLAYSVESGRPLPQELEVMSEHQRRIDIRERVARMQHASALGDPIWNVFAAEGLIRVPEAAALEAASRAGNLHWGMRTLADSIEQKRQHRLQFWLEFLKPAAVLSVGCVVAFFVIAFFLPLVKLIQELT